MLRKWFGLISVALGLALALVMPSRVLACSCAPPLDPTAEMEQSTAVFAGRVYSIENSGGVLWVHLEVSQVWKGPYQSLMTVHTADNSAACGYNFIGETEYLVYAYGDLNNLEVNLCGRTRLLNDAAEDIKILGPGTPINQMTGEDKPDPFDPNRILAPIISLISGGIILGILLNGLLDFRPARR